LRRDDNDRKYWIKSMDGSFINVVVKHNTHANTPLVFSIIDGTEEKIIFAAHSSTLL